MRVVDHFMSQSILAFPCYISFFFKLKPCTSLGFYQPWSLLRFPAVLIWHLFWSRQLRGLPSSDGYFWNSNSLECFMVQIAGNLVREQSVSQDLFEGLQKENIFQGQRNISNTYYVCNIYIFGNIYVSLSCKYVQIWCITSIFTSNNMMKISGFINIKALFRQTKTKYVTEKWDRTVFELQITAWIFLWKQVELRWSFVVIIISCSNEQY